MTTGGLPDATIKKLRADLLDAHNSMRRSFGNAPALKRTDGLTNHAQYWSNHLASIGGLEHGDFTGPVYGQNVGHGSLTVAGIMRQWRESCGHLHNLAWPGWKQVGFGISKRGSDYYWVADFGGNTQNFCFSNYCPNSTCNGSSGHDFYSNDRWKP